jgi:hypothetical protein
MGQKTLTRPPATLSRRERVAGGRVRVWESTSHRIFVGRAPPAGKGQRRWAVPNLRPTMCRAIAIDAHDRRPKPLLAAKTTYSRVSVSLRTGSSMTTVWGAATTVSMNQK